MSLTLKGITKSFDGKTVFRDLSYDFPDTGLFLIVGESGVGKTTLLRLISGLDARFSGEIVGGGLKNSSLAFQEYRLIPELTAVENIAVTLSEKLTDESLSIAEKALTELGFSEADTRLYPHEMSGGMKQRTSLARAFLKKSPLLLLDEPTKELDGENVGLLISKIAEESKCRLVIAVTHEPSHFSSLPHTVITLE
jgi:ABC-type nitrate/sulfonate/bicarbonate transport system ATPase subunit